MSFLRTFGRGLFTNGARTDAAKPAAGLRGRVYPIPFDTVWHLALGLAEGGLRRWSVTESDDGDGIIRAEIASFLLRPDLEATIRIGLDADAQTRVDAEALAPGRRIDLGASARVLARFLDALDRELEKVTSSKQGAAAP